MNIRLRSGSYALASIALACLLAWVGRNTWRELHQLHQNFESAQVDAFHLSEFVEGSVRGLDEIALRFDQTPNPADQAAFKRLSLELLARIRAAQAADASPGERELVGQLDRAFAEKWMPPRIWDAVTSPTLAERIHKWTPPDPNQPGNYDWNARDIAQFGAEYFLMASGYFGLYERCYGMLSIPTMFITMAAEPHLANMILDKITDYKVEMAKEFVKMDFISGHVGDDLGTQTGPFVPPKIFTALLLPLASV